MEKAREIKSWWIVYLTFVGILFLLAGCEQSTPKPETQRSIPEGPRVGFRAPVFSIPTLNGNTLDLSNYRGKVIMINFWATWCGPCRIEMPSMEDLYSKYGGKDFEILAVNGGEDRNLVQPFIKNLNLSFPILLDQQFEIHNQYQVTAIPSTFLVDKSGVITHRFFGFMDWTNDHSREIITKLIKAKS
jgi:peroxiredoxin